MPAATNKLKAAPPAEIVKQGGRRGALFGTRGSSAFMAKVPGPTGRRAKETTTEEAVRQR